MTYLQFHLVFILPAIVALLGFARRGAGRIGRPLGYIALVAVIAFVYTTPWDNYLVWRGVWGYGNERVLGTVGYVPIEEYAFFLLQPVLTGFWVYGILGRVPPQAVAQTSRARWIGMGFYLVVAAAGFAALARDSTLYAGLILAWAAPVLAGQWGYAGREIWRRRKAFALGVMVPTVYLWIADAIAIHLGIWSIAERYTIGLEFGPLPFEEALFFLVTNLLVVQGLILFLYPPGARDETGRPADERARAGAA
jgi:lycopene beta-cyclase